MSRTLALLVAALLLTAPASAATSGQNPGFVPGDLFYPVEKAVESIEVKIAGAIGGPDMKAKALANNADERVAKAQKLSQRNRSDRAEKVMEDYNRTMQNSKETAEKSGDKGLKNDIENITRRNEEVLNSLENDLPSQAQKGIQTAVNNSNKTENETPSKTTNRTGKSEKPLEKPVNVSNLSNGSSKDITDTTGQNEKLDKVRNKTEAANLTDDEILDESNSNEESDDGLDQNLSESVTGGSVTGKDLPEKGSKDNNEEKNPSEGLGETRGPF